MTHGFSRRGLLLGLGLTALVPTLAACGNDSGAGSGTGTGPTSPATSPAATGTRTVTDSTGAKVEVPVKPARVVTLHYAGTQAVIDLGATPIAQAAFVEANVPEAWVTQLKAIPVVTTADGPVIDKILALEPDLILAPNTLKDDVLAQLGKAAPVYQFLLRGGKRAEWQTRVEQIADALNITDAYTKLKADFAQEQQALATKYADLAKTLVVGCVASYEENNAYLWGSANMVGTLLTPLGVTWSSQEDAAVAKESEPEATVSFEKLATSVGDATVIFHDSDMRGTPSAFTKAMLASPLYQQLPAVAAGKQFPFGKMTVAGFSDARYSLGLVGQAFAKLKG